MREIQSDTTDSGSMFCEASRVLTEGGIVCFPTETFYGLGVKYDLRPAHEKLFRLKQRRPDKPLPLIIGRLELLDLLVEKTSALEELLMRSFWPGPLTLLLPARPDLPDFVTAGRPGHIAVRIPGASVALDLARALDFPITATSANISGMPAADSPEKVLRYFAAAPDLLINGGRTPGGNSSTIAEVRGDAVTIVRPGVISEAEIEAVLRAAGYDR
jgi:L-threonylcarbamoyladenylate synthase